MGVPIQQECVTYFVPALQMPCFLRLVMQEKETCLETRSLGSILIFSGEAYKKHYGRDAVQDDGLQAEDWKSPTGATHRVFKASTCHFSYGLGTIL